MLIYLLYISKKTVMISQIKKNILKTIWTILYEQIDSHNKNILPKYQGELQKKFSSRHSLLLMFEKWKKVLDNDGSCGALLVDLPKAFDCMVHDLLLAKLSAYGLDYNSLKLIAS